MAAYPEDIYSPLPALLVDNVDVVLARHVNELRDELRAVQRLVGRNPNVTGTIRPDARPGVDYITTSNATWNSLTLRLENVEKAALRNLDSLYVKIAGGSIISSSPSGGGLGVRPPVNSSFASIELLKAGKGWDASDDARAAIRLWNSGLIEGGTLQLAIPGSEVVIDPGASTVIDAGAVTVGSSGLISSGTKAKISGSVDAAFRALFTVSPGDNPTQTTSFSTDEFGEVLQYGGVNALRIDTTGSPNLASILLTKDGATTLRITAAGNMNLGNGNILLSSSQQRITVGSAMLTSTGLSVGNSVEVNATRLKIGSTQLTNSQLIMGTSSLVNADTTLKVQSQTNGTITVGPKGVINHPLWTLPGASKPGAEYDEYRSFLKVSSEGVFGTTVVSGNLELPTCQTAYWPRLDNDKAVIWIKTRPRSTQYASDLEPTYWDPMYHWIDGPEVQSFTIVAPATGDVKITLQGEVWGNVSRSAVSYEIRDQFGNVVLAPGGGHAISFNAPIASTPEDHYYVNLSNTFFTTLIPGNTYSVRLLAQRSIPGGDAAGPYFPWHPNYSWTYPWGQWFSVKYPRVIVEPSFSAVYPRG